VYRIAPTVKLRAKGCCIGIAGAFVWVGVGKV
jgi:hypothetical protein